jgi:anthranilate synthase component 2
MKTLVIDNYDSFVYNLVQYIGELGSTPIVYRNDKITLAMVKRINPDNVIISPGPGNPTQKKYFGIGYEILEKISPSVPTLGVCLGCQGFGHFFSAKITHAKKLLHGKTSIITHDGMGIFKNIPNKIKVARYHSLVVDPKTISDELKITAKSEDKEIMGLRHKKYPIEGVQFHPESILTEYGKDMIRNFLMIRKESLRSN